ncbi:MAG TPA: glycosyltransferase family 4 protein [Verrucomicrobiae bacterium]|nr:glycosyltransferase family 4 protein [Verrucomicrobiae bacterium]
MRILFLTSYRRKIGGTESYLDAIVPAYMRRGNDVGICYTEDGPANRRAFEFPPEIREWQVKVCGAPQTIAQIRDWKPDLIFSHGSTDVEFEAQLLTLAPGVFFAHDYKGTCISGLKAHKFPTPVPCTRLFGPACLVQYFPRRCGGRSPVTMFRLYAKQSSRLRLLRRYAVIATNSEHLTEEYRRHGLIGHRLPYPVFADGKERPRSIRTDESKKRWRILFVGRMDKLKGGQMLLKALPAIRAGVDHDVHLVFVGDGPERKVWQRAAERTQSATSGVEIEFKGWLEKSQVAQAYAEADLLVVPSLWPEPCGVVGVEAGLYSVPSVAFRVGGIPDWLHPGENGFLAPGDPPTAGGLAAAAVRALDPEIHPGLCEGARKLAQSWTLELHCDEFDLLVEKVIRGSFASAGSTSGETPASVSADAERL